MIDVEVPVFVMIRKNSTGEIRVHPDVLLADEDGNPDPYIWENGNYSCDCNRRLFFERALGEEESWNDQCSTGEYSVYIIESTPIFSDFKFGDFNE